MKVSRGILRVIIGLLMVLPAACGRPSEKPKRAVVGIVNVTPVLEDTVAGLKTGLAELGYKENDNIRYFYEGPLGSMDKVEGAVKGILAEKPDLIVSLSTPVTLKVKKATEGMDVPVLFAPSADPVGAGLVKSLKAPEGRFTGITVGGSGIKALAWLAKIVPDLKRVYVPFNPEDKAMVLNMKELKTAVGSRKIELVFGEFHSKADVLTVLNHIPVDVQAVWQLPSPFWGVYIEPFVATCIKHKKPLKTHTFNWVKAGALMSYGLSPKAMGNQLSHMAYKILKGTSPAGLPMERVRFFLAVNLKTAGLIGLEISDAVLKQADEIIR